MSLLIPAVKQTLVPGAKGVQVVSQAPLTPAQKNKLKEAGGGTFRFVTHSDQLSVSIKHWFPNSWHARSFRVP